MKNFKPLLLLQMIILFAASVPAQNTIVRTQPPTTTDLLKMITALQESNKALEDKISKLQAQVNLNHKAQDFVLGLVQKKTDAQGTALDAVTNKVDAMANKVTVFTVSAGPSNLTDVFSPPTNTLPGKYYRSVIIDNPACNNNPYAIVLAISQQSGFGYNLPVPIAVSYDKSINKWKIIVNPNETNSTITGLAKPTQGSNMVSVLEYYPYQINQGDKFNVEVIKP